MSHPRHFGCLRCAGRGPLLKLNVHPRATATLVSVTARRVGHLPQANGIISKHQLISLSLLHPFKKLTPLEWVQDLRRGNASLSGLSRPRPPAGCCPRWPAPGPGEPAPLSAMCSVCAHVVLHSGKSHAWIQSCNATAMLCVKHSELPI